MNIDIDRAIAEFSYGLPITVEGIGLGSHASEIPRGAIMSSSPNLSSEIIERSGSHFRVLENGSEVQISADEKYQMVLEHGGWFSSRNITWKIVDQKVNLYRMKDTLFNQFDIRSEASIIERFGKPECVLMNGTGKEYTYMSRKLKLVWAVRESRLYSVDIGDFTTPQSVRDEDAKRGVFHIGGVRRVTMTSLKQDLTYSGLICGQPNKAINDSIIEEAKKTVLNDKCLSGNIRFIIPKRRALSLSNAGLGTSETLPSVRCVAQLESAFPAHDYEEGGSCAVVVWFQSQLAMPIDKEIIKEIELLDWCYFARDFTD